MSDFHGFDRIAARFHGVEEVAHVVVRGERTDAFWEPLDAHRQMDFPGTDLRVLQRVGRGFQGFIREFDPTLRPFKAAPKPRVVVWHSNSTPLA